METRLIVAYSLIGLIVATAIVSYIIFKRRQSAQFRNSRRWK